MPHLNREFNRYLEDAPVEQLRLLEDRVLCRVLKRAKNVSRFRIEGTFEYQDKVNIGRVLLLGRDYAGPLQVGNYCIFEPWVGREFQSADETLILLRGPQVDAVVEM